MYIIQRKTCERLMSTASTVVIGEYNAITKIVLAKHLKLVYTDFNHLGTPANYTCNNFDLNYENLQL